MCISFLFITHPRVDRTVHIAKISNVTRHSDDISIYMEIYVPCGYYCSWQQYLTTLCFQSAMLAISPKENFQFRISARQSSQIMKQKAKNRSLPKIFSRSFSFSVSTRSIYDFSHLFYSKEYSKLYLIIISRDDDRNENWPMRHARRTWMATLENDVSPLHLFILLIVHAVA